MKKRFGILLLINMLIISFLSGCGAEEEENGAETDSQVVQEGEVIPGWQLHADDKVTLQWYVNYSWFTTPWGENLVSRTITEETGVDIEFITPRSNENEKFNSMISSGKLPDIITLGWWETQIDEMIDKDMVYALNELADEYDAYFWQVADERIMRWNEREDGNVYFYPNSFYLPEDYEKYGNIGSNQTFLVRKDIYEAIGSPDMTTQEGFKEAVRKAVEMFPEVNGEPLIPIGAHVFNETGCVSFDQYLQNFLAVPYEKNGEYYDRYTDPEFISWLKLFRELGSEGYLAKDIFIDQRTQMEEKLAEGRYFCMLYQRTDMEAQQKELYAKNPEQIYIAVDGPKNSNGDDHILPGTGSKGWTVTLISKSCERPDRALELFSYLMSERGQKMTNLGVEGVTYSMVTGEPVLKPDVKLLLNTNRAEYDKLYGADNAYWMLTNNVMQLQWRDEPEGPMAQLEKWTYKYTHYMGQYEIDFLNNTEVGNADTNIKKLWSQTLPKLLLAESEEEFDALLQEFVEKREDLGYDLVVKECERQTKDAKERLGMK
uniref:extracellular solute-binding protein n=1 Tax=Acetatifactor sp. TaxID=1872090 RepID=UPI004055EC44